METGATRGRPRPESVYVGYPRTHRPKSNANARAAQFRRSGSARRKSSAPRARFCAARTRASSPARTCCSTAGNAGACCRSASFAPRAVGAGRRTRRPQAVIVGYASHSATRRPNTTENDMRIGTMLSMPGDNSGVTALVERGAAAEAAGFASVWLPQVFTIDALTILALAGAATRTIELGTAVVPTYLRQPIALATQALTVQDATRNRLALGIGLSHKFVIEDMFGLDYSKPIPHMKDYLTILNGLLAGERVQHKGAEYAVSVQVAVPGTKRPPVIVAALGPAMLKLCGRLADGTLTWMGGIDYLRDIAIPTMSAAATAAKRAAPRFVAMVPTLLTANVAAGRVAVNTTFAMYGQVPSYRATLDRGGASNPADVAVIGNEAAIEAGMNAYANVGVTDFVAVVPMNAPETKATMEFVATCARSKRTPTA